MAQPDMETWSLIYNPAAGRFRPRVRPALKARLGKASYGIAALCALASPHPTLTLALPLYPPSTFPKMWVFSAILRGRSQMARFGPLHFPRFISPGLALPVGRILPWKPAS